MKNDPKLVDLAELKRLMDGVELVDDKSNEYINARWLKYVEWWDWRSTTAKRRYLALRSAVVIGGALIPAFVGLREAKYFGSYDWVFSIASIIASLVVAVCAGLESLFGFGDIWREKRNAAEILKSEGFAFLQLGGGYEHFQSHKEAHKTFVKNVEDIIRGEIKDYILAVAPQSPSGGRGSGTSATEQ